MPAHSVTVRKPSPFIGPFLLLVAGCATAGIPPPETSASGRRGTSVTETSAVDPAVVGASRDEMFAALTKQRWCFSMRVSETSQETEALSRLTLSSRGTSETEDVEGVSLTQHLLDLPDRPEKPVADIRSTLYWRRGSPWSRTFDVTVAPPAGADGSSLLPFSHCSGAATLLRHTY